VTGNALQYVRDVSARLQPSARRTHHPNIDPETAMNLVIRKRRHVWSPERLLDHRAALRVTFSHF
jgi:hypothetical protein